MSDLITSDYLLNCAAAGGRSLSTAEQTVSGQVISAASRLARKHCNRYFTRTTYDGLYTLDFPSKVFLLRQYPLNNVIRIATNPTTVLSISNSDDTTNQRAYVRLVTTGNTDIADLPLTVTGLACVRIASGVVVSNEGGGTLLFSAYPTVQDLADAVNALGHSWTATVKTDYGGWPTADPENAGLSYFRPIQSAMPCLGAGQVANLKMHLQDLAVETREDIAEVDLSHSYEDDPFASLRFGQYLSTDIGDLNDYGGFQGIRVIYDAGLDTVYEDVQQAIVELALDMLNLLSLDQRVAGENDGSYSYTAITADRLANFALPPSVRGKLAYYRNSRA